MAQAVAATPNLPMPKRSPLLTLSPLEGLLPASPAGATLAAAETNSAGQPTKSLRTGETGARSSGSAYDAPVSAANAEGGPGPTRVAIIDLGTNSTRLLIADASGGRL